MVVHEDKEAARSLARLLPRLALRVEGAADPAVWQVFVGRVERHFAPLFRSLLELYGLRYEFFYHLEEILASAARSWIARPRELQALDAAREHDPAWFQSQRMVGAVCYVDLFAGNLCGLAGKIDYLRELGITYLHLMPLFRSPEGNSDGGYAVSSYREVNPKLGTMEDLATLAEALRVNGISLVLDFIFNHTSDEHDWAKQALAGDEEYQDYYYVFPDRSQPDAYQQHLRDIFPDQRAGSFTYRPEIDKWVWTTFHSFQWDLNYANPAVFRRMGEEMLFLANQGAEVLRLDAVAFAWKQLGTPCESLPQVHTLVRAFNSLARIAAPSLLFKSEAIVHPDEVARYISPEECQISYNPLVMALSWESLATREVRLLQLSLQERFQTDPGSAWVNYVRSHDDIGWTFADSDAWRLGIDSVGHRRFLNEFYTGKFFGSFAAGLPFQENPRTGDARISGTCASLAGLEQAIGQGDARLIDLAIQRILLLYGVALSVGGIPLLYLGDELGTLNDYTYLSDPAKSEDSRWVHRPALDCRLAERRHDARTTEGRIFQGLAHLICLRKESPALAGGSLVVVPSGSGSVLCYLRVCGAERLVVLANFSEHEQIIHAGTISGHLQTSTCIDLLSNTTVSRNESILLAAYSLQWLVDGGK